MDKPSGDKPRGPRSGAKEGRAKPAPGPDAAGRRQRLAEELRANLLKRKQQARARRAGDGGSEPGRALAGDIEVDVGTTTEAGPGDKGEGEDEGSGTGTREGA